MRPSAREDWCHTSSRLIGPRSSMRWTLSFTSNRRTCLPTCPVTTTSTRLSSPAPLAVGEYLVDPVLSDVTELFEQLLGPVQGEAAGMFGRIDIRH